jgi:hypothetical protein
MNYKIIFFFLINFMLHWQKGGEETHNNDNILI